MIRALLLTIVVLLLARAFWRVIDGIMEAASGQSDRRANRASPVKLVRDPVCGTYVAPGSALSLTAKGSTHYFCSEECRAKYRHA